MNTNAKEYYSLLRTGLALLILFSSCAQSNEFPTDKATLSNCQELQGFNYAPGGIKNSYLYGFHEKYRKHESVIFWCEASTTDRIVYKLVGYVKNSTDIPCSGVVYQTNNYPGGLSVHKENDLDTVGYTNISKPNSIKPPITFSGNLIKSFYDGHGNTFFCDGGNWFIAYWH